MKAAAAQRLVVISGCSGGGKSTLLAELERRGHAVVEEPGRRVVQAALRSGEATLPWIDMAGFLRRCIALALDDHARAARHQGSWVFFDRSLVDAVAALQALPGEALPPVPPLSSLYHPRVFLTPPWPEIYVQDAERRHAMEAAQAEFERLQLAYPALGYEALLLPKLSVAERADWVLQSLAQA
ncbi:MAG: AAA family ATPase [Acidovorax sp.]|jgi:predicted ATPase|nr:AAA family ATPase [Acidovorax sp.]